MSTKSFSFGQLLTEQQAQLARDLYNAHQRGELQGTFAKNAMLKIFTPETMAHIDKVLGQKNDAMYFAYALEYALSQAG